MMSVGRLLAVSGRSRITMGSMRTTTSLLVSHRKPLGWMETSKEGQCFFSTTNKMKSKDTPLPHDAIPTEPPVFKKLVEEPQVENKPQEEEGKTKQTKAQKVKMMLKKYGPIGFVTHITLSLISLGTWFTLVRTGVVDPRAVLRFLDINLGDWIHGDETTFALAYVCHKSTAIVRYPITLTVTPYVAERFEKIKLQWKKPSQPQ